MSILDKIPFLPPDLKTKLGEEIEKVKAAWNVHVKKDADDHREILQSITDLKNTVDNLIRKLDEK